LPAVASLRHGYVPSVVYGAHAALRGLAVIPRSHIPPLWREARIGLEAAALLRDPVFRGDGLVDGRGRPVLLIPGFMAGDGSLAMMAGWLKRGGYKPCKSGMLANVDCSSAALDRLERRLERLVAAQGSRAAIIGQSRGGGLAKVLAGRRPDLVAGIITLGSPHIDLLAIHPLVRLQVEAVSRLGSLGAPRMFKRSCIAGDCCASFRKELAAPLPAGVGFVAVYSRSDGVVDWRSCLDPHAGTHVEIRSSHCGMAVSPAAWRAVGGALAAFRKAEARRRPEATATVRRLPRAA
jgi:triacylglycerol lipase